MPRPFDCPGLRYHLVDVKSTRNIFNSGARKAPAMIVPVLKVETVRVLDLAPLKD